MCAFNQSNEELKGVLSWLIEVTGCWKRLTWGITCVFPDTEILKNFSMGAAIVVYINKQSDWPSAKD